MVVVSQSMTQEIKIELERLPESAPLGDIDFQTIPFWEANRDRYWVPWVNDEVGEDIGAWVSADGCQVTLVAKEFVYDPEEYDADYIEQFLRVFLALVKGTCFSLQGQVSIHANAVVIDDRAIGFIGDSGAGKSTLTAYCASQGADLMTDDVLVLNHQGQVYPGEPHIKLFPHTGQQFGLDTAAEVDYKLYFDPSQLGTKLRQQATPLGALYFLAEGEQISIDSLPHSQIIFELLGHSYYANELILQRPELLDTYVQLAEQFPIKRLSYPRDFSVLPQVYDRILQDLRSG